MTALIDEVRRLVERATHLQWASRPELDEVAHRLDEPLRVAIAGRVKAGKSTLLNALVGEELAPTDAGECTRIVTWYVHGLTYRVTLHLPGGERRSARFTREGGALSIDLGGLNAASIERIVVEWPAPALERLTLIDTPGITSADTEVSARTTRLLDGGGEADAVLYLMRHLHRDDLDFLEAFQQQPAAASAVNACGVLARADEIGVGRADAMRSARRIAERYRHDPRLRRLCRTVVPVAALLAETAATLTQDEFAALEALAAAPRETCDAMLLSVDRFAAEGAPVPVPAVYRSHLLVRLGVFGVRTAITAIRQGIAPTAGRLAEVLAKRSGVEAVRHELVTRFAGRADILKARSALASLETIAARPGGDELRAELERLTAAAHELAEIRVLDDHRGGVLGFGSAEGEMVERLLAGTSVCERLGIDPGAPVAEVRGDLLTTIDRFRRRAENPLSSPALAAAAHVVVRSCEVMLSGLPADH